MTRPTGGPRSGFTSPPSRADFNTRVWQIVEQIPRGRVATYGQIGAMVKRPAGTGVRHYHAARARWVGQAMANCPPGLPWQRVVNSQGRISVRPGSDSHVLQRTLLEREGIEFDARGRIDLARYGWENSPRRR